MVSGFLLREVIFVPPAFLSVLSGTDVPSGTVHGGHGYGKSLSPVSSRDARSALPATMRAAVQAAEARQRNDARAASALSSVFLIPH